MCVMFVFVVISIVVDNWGRRGDRFSSGGRAGGSDLLDMALVGTLVHQAEKYKKMLLTLYTADSKLKSLSFYFIGKIWIALDDKQ